MKKIWEREMWMVLGFLAGCFALGLLGGILFAHLAYPWRNGQNQMLELYALTQIKNKTGKSAEYFWYLLENRMFAVAFFLLTGLTGAARFIVVVAGGKPSDSGTGNPGVLDLCRFVISTDDCIFSRGCTADDKNL